MCCPVTLHEQHLCFRPQMCCLLRVTQQHRHRHRYSQMLQLIPGRECGDCPQCCILPAIDKPKFQKQPASVCRHCEDGGCNIYETRPQTCRTYYCGWRWLEIFEDDWRPDK